MIGSLKGRVIGRDGRSLILEVGGVGFRIFTNDHNLQKAAPGKEMSFFTHLAVKENGLELYGFESKEELDFFGLLISVSGVGPKTALGVLNVAPVKILNQAIASGDTTHLIRVSGLGKKTAEKIVLELKDKLAGSFTDPENLKDEVEALEALLALGYSRDEARGALRKIAGQVKGTSEKIKESLKILSNR